MRPEAVEPFTPLVIGLHAAARDTAESHALGEALKAHVRSKHGTTIDALYWKFPPV